MANKRIKDISTTATSAASDDFVVIDGAASGTRKINAGPLGGNFDENIVVENGGNKTTYATNFLRSENSSYYIDAYNVGGDILFRTSVASAVDTTSMIIDGATGNVSIGGTGAARKLHVTSSGTIAQFESTSTAAYVSLKESGGNHTYLGNAGGDFVIQTSDGGYSSKLVVYNGGNVAVPQGNLNISNGNLGFDTAGKGIDFSATSDGSGTASSEVLSDYEVGTAEVAFGSGGGSVTISSTRKTIFYTKIGRQVHINGELTVDSVSSPTGELTITGLPFASASTAGNRGAISLHASLLTGSTRLSGFVEQNQSYVNIRLTGATGHGQTSAAVIQAGSSLIIGGTYTAAS